MKVKKDVRDLILDATENIVIEIGSSNLTLSAVAKRAGISKGGLLYHFPSKLDLLQEMIHRMAKSKKNELEKFAEKFLDTPSRKLKAHITSWFNESEKRKKFIASMMAAMAYNPNFVGPFRKLYREGIQELEKGLDPIMARIIALAAEGLWFTDILGLKAYSEEEQKEISEKLMELADKSILRNEA